MYFDCLGVLDVKSVLNREAKSIKSLVAALRKCGKENDLNVGKALHAAAVEAGHSNDRYVSAALITMYSNCGRMCNAREVFDQAVHPDVVQWTSLIMGYVENGESFTALELFQNMHGCEPNSVTFIAALKAVSGLASRKRVEREICLEKGKKVHRGAKHRECAGDILVASSLMDMYCKCGSTRHARAVFDTIPRRNVVSWNVLLMGYAENGEFHFSLELFLEMDCEPNSVTFVAALKACISLARCGDFHKAFCLEKGIEVHRKAKAHGVESELFVASMLVDMYSKCGGITFAKAVFDSLAIRDVVLWSNLILGYVENGEELTAMDLFTKMDCQPNAVTLIGALKACGSLGALEAGEKIHVQICELGLEQDHVLATCLVDFYRKCGAMPAAEEVFERMHLRDMLSWNSLISGYVSAGEATKVFSLVKRMQEEDGFQPNEVTFLSLLTACSHAGLVEEGKKYFELMLGCGVSPNVEHYACLIDMFRRADRLHEASSLLEQVNNVIHAQKTLSSIASASSKSFTSAKLKSITNISKMV